MAGPFEAVTRVAIEEMVLARVSEGKFGYVISHENLSNLLEDLYGFVKTSRELKAQGDKLLSKDFGSAPQRNIKGAQRARKP